MKKDKPPEKQPNEHRALLQKKVERQMTSLEIMIQDLLNGVVISDLNSKERLTMATRLIALHQRSIALGDLLEQHQTENHENIALSAIIQKMRAEEEKEKFLTIDADITTE